ncbi:putative F-box protein At5g55150 [Macadamia integrifolia]|uniref:putative F-box protein At5g55150 n=1 Tax=Macadamia integrifolia TaxID=60698 RepID=UPI001C531722|nr:putative F-box protein At5g55150 [Macadamia integrifolia]
MDFVRDCNTISFSLTTGRRNVENIIVALPKDIMIFILNKLDLVSFHNFSKVCLSWQWIALAAKNKIPWIFSLFNSKLFRLELPPEVYETKCCGSNWGWLIMEGINQGNNFLLNPMTRVLIGLPPKATLPSLNHIDKAILLSPPLDNKIGSLVATNDCVVMVIYSSLESDSLGLGCLAFCRLRDEKWTAIENNHSWFEDIIFYNGVVYAINFKFDIVLVEFDPNPKGTRCHIAPPAREFDSRALKDIYLVESLGELLVVLRCRLFLNQSGTFKIFKLDTKGRCWIKVEDLGDQMIFISKTSTGFSRSALDYHGFRRNSIYFYLNESKCDKLGEFHLEDDSISSFDLDYWHSLPFLSIWFTSTSRL